MVRLLVNKSFFDTKLIVKYIDVMKIERSLNFCLLLFLIKGLLMVSAGAYIVINIKIMLYKT